jgi:hydroxymethylbilane synthase
MFRIGTRASPLAMAQARMTAAALCAAHGWSGDAVELCPVVASGDKVLDRPLAEIGGKALWTKELDRALGEGAIDCAVHSMKDVETFRPPELSIAAMLPRADVRDRLIGAESLDALAHGARFGTSAPRRRAQLLRLRPDLEIVLFRGNVQTRLARIERGEADATLLAAAGLERLAMTDVGVAVPIETLLPAPAQGAIGVETRTGDARARDLLAAIDHDETRRCVGAERALLAALSGDCRSPVAALATISAQGIRLRAEIYSESGADCEAGDLEFEIADQEAPHRLASDLLDRAPEAVKAAFGR